MKTSTKAAIITFVVAIPAFMTGRLIWPPAGPQPTPAQLPHLMVFTAVESLALGLGIALLVLGRSHVKKVPPQDRKLATAAHLSIVWMLVNWWPHDNMHASNGENLDRLIRIEYTFHVTLVIATLIVAKWFLRTLRPTKPAQQP
jgi:hypothetical protein